MAGVIPLDGPLKLPRASLFAVALGALLLTPATAPASDTRFKVDPGCPVTISDALINSQGAGRYEVVIVMGGTAKHETASAPLGYFGIVRVVATDPTHPRKSWSSALVVPNVIETTYFGHYRAGVIGGPSYNPIPSNAVLSVRLHCSPVPPDFAAP